MATNLSSENLLDSDDSLAPNHRKPLRRVSQPGTASNDNLVDLDESSEDNSVHVVRPFHDAPKHAINTHIPTPLDRASASAFTTTSYGVWEKKKPSRWQVQQTAADVHRPSELQASNSDLSLVPVPLPRRKLIDVTEVMQSSSQEEDDNDDGRSTNFFAQNRQNTMVSQNDRSSSASLDNNDGPPKPMQRTKLIQAINHQLSSSSDGDRKNHKLKLLAAVKSDLSDSTSIQNTGEHESRLDYDGTDADISTGLSESVSADSHRHPAISVQTIDEKKRHHSYTASRGKTAPPKPARKMRSNTSDSQKNLMQSKKYTYEKIIGIYIHESSALTFDYSLLMAPMVRVSVFDVVNGRLLVKSDPARSAVHHHEPSAVNFVQPLVSRSCTFKKSETIECVWEELLLINDDIKHLQTGNEIVFFEIVSMMNMPKKDFVGVGDTDGWHHICWAFLRPGDSATYSHVDQRSRLQLFVYQTKGCFRPRKMSILEQWRMRRHKYPATLDVTVKGILPTSGHANHQVLFKNRPMHALEGDLRLDYMAVDRPTSGQHLMEDQSANQFFAKDLHNTEEDSFNNLLGRDRKLPGQSCKIPNYVSAALHQSNAKGSLVAKFSPNGQQLAVAIVPDTIGNQQHDIVIVQVPGFRKLALLQGHSAVIYSLDWYEADADGGLCYLLSVSSDRTAIAWKLNRGCVNLSLTILPHPCFVYSGVCLRRCVSKLDLWTVTGGRDGLLRVWKSCANEETDLLQELHGHDTYITSIVSSKDSTKLYSSDSSGCILEWIRTVSNLYERSRAVKSLHSNIHSLQLHRNEETLFLSCATVTSLNIRSGVQLHTFDLSHNDPSTDQRNCFALSPCGSMMITANGATLQGWNLLTGHKSTAYTIPLHSATDNRNYISSIDFHPHSFKLSITIYGASLDAGVIVLDHAASTDQRPTASPHPPLVDYASRAAALKRIPSAGLQKPTAENLGNIIQRIDDIFRLPQNRTDDLKSRSSRTITHKAINNTFVVDSDNQVAGMELLGLKRHPFGRAMSLQRSATFTVANEEAANNQTFSIASGERLQNANTFDVSRGLGEANGNGDDTTISESL